MNSRWSRRLPLAAAIAACQPPAFTGLDEPASSSGTTATGGEHVDPPTTGGEPETTSTTLAETTAATTSAATGATTGDDPTGTGDAAATTGAVDPPTCGDAVVDPGEACDLGYAANRDDGACTTGCQIATCGDGLVWSGEEQCDDGPDNNDTTYAGCTTQCELGPRCGDGVLQAEEECDLAELNGTGEFLPDGVPCQTACRFNARVVFLSSALYRGGDIGGVAQADDKCQDLALAAGFDNHLAFMAWLSDGQSSPAERFTKHPDPPSPYVLPSGIRLADGWDDLLLHGPGDGIIETEEGDVFLDDRPWTNTNANGEGIQPNTDCHGWTDSTPGYKSHAGRTGVDPADTTLWKTWEENKQWTVFTTSLCNSLRRLYCFEQ